ncbi:MAG TPA: hypothetical protein VFM02_04255 [Candidatus Paceibacterota bacterium]|nr:hypothetical protein [Candidatus Paceibacterota bacterium]
MNQNRVFWGKDKKVLGKSKKSAFLQGMGRIFDFFNILNVYKISKRDGREDVRALSSDWLAVGKDLRFAVAAYGKEQTQKETRVKGKRG